MKPHSILQYNILAMQTDLDMSGRIEETNRPTAIAITNDVSASIRIAASEKRLLINALRKRKPRWGRVLVHVYVFSTLVYLLVKDHIEHISLVRIDPEYPGYEQDIKDRVMSLCRRQGIKIHKDQIAFQRVGKKSQAHKLAFSVYKRFIEADRIVKAEDVLMEFGK